MRRTHALAALLACAPLAAGCSEAGGDGVIDVAIIGDPAALGERGLRLDSVGQHVRAASAQGLVRLDETGNIVPGIAESWIVTDDGTSYIFRIREFDLADGERLTAQGVRDSLQRTIAGLEGTSMGLDLARLRDVRAMTGRVIEVRLDSAMPDLLQVLAQPEMALAIGDSALGPMVARRDGEALLLSAMPPEARGLPAQPGWADEVRDVRLSAVPARAATEGFAQGRYDVILGGTLADFPLADAGPLSRGTIRLDSALGLFGLDIRRQSGFLAEPANREALSLALDRAALIQPFNIAGWVPATRIVPEGLRGAADPGADRWAGTTLDERRERARQVVAAWSRSNGEVVLQIALPQGPGSDILLTGLAAQWDAIGVRLVRLTGPGAEADLVLRDRVARYAGARWFLNQFHCRVTTSICSEDVDFLVELAVDARDPAESASYLAEARDALDAFHPFIPIGAPIRWSMVRADVEGFAENPWNLHPLFALSRAPI